MTTLEISWEDHDCERAEIKIGDKVTQFEFVDWANCSAEERKELCTFFFTFEDDDDFEGIAGGAWLAKLVPIAISGDIDDDSH